jgi:microcystin-dependent protein
MMQAPSPPLPPPSMPLSMGTPVGSIIAFAGEVYGSSKLNAGATNTERWGWLLCDGRQLHRAKFPELFAVLGYRYRRAGESESGPLFRVPDLRGYFLRGVESDDWVPDESDERHTSDGTTVKAPCVGSIQDCAFQIHEHTYDQPVASGVQPGQGAEDKTFTINGAVTGSVVAQPSGENAQKAQPLTSNTETRPRNVSVHYLIKFATGHWPIGAPFAPF